MFLSLYRRPQGLASFLIFPQSHSQAQQPKAFILENVIGLRKVLDEVMAALHEAGDYMIAAILIDAADLGVPNLRDRYYILGIKKDSVHDSISTEEDLHEHCKKALKANRLAYHPLTLCPNILADLH